MPQPASADRPDLLVDASRAAELKAASQDWPSWDLTARQLCDLEMLASGAFAPLTSFLDEADQAAVMAGMRLADGTLWPVPVTLDVDRDLAGGLELGDRVALRDPEGTMLAALTVTSRFSSAVVGTGTISLGGPLDVLQLPNRYDFTHLRRTPVEVRDALQDSGWARVLAVTTWQPLLAADLGELKAHVNRLGARVLVLAVAGQAPAGTLDHFALTRSLEAGLAELPEAASMLTLLPLAVHDDPARQALLEAIVARAHGATHVRAPADADAARLVSAHAREVGVRVVPRPPTSSGPTISASDVHRRLESGDELPDGVAPAAVLDELRRAVPPRHESGLTVFFTGLSGSGKSTVANIVATRLREYGGRAVTLLDGDLVRQFLSSELGFGRKDRNLNVLRIGYVASEIARHRGIAVCAPIAPYDEIRRQNRRMVEAAGGGFVLVHVATPLEVCEARDRKGLYAKARAGMIDEFTGISDPYEVPDDAEVRLDTTDITPEQAAAQVIEHLVQAGWLPG